MCFPANLDLSQSSSRIGPAPTLDEAQQFLRDRGFAVLSEGLTAHEQANKNARIELKAMYPARTRAAQHAGAELVNI